MLADATVAIVFQNEATLNSIKWKLRNLKKFITIGVPIKGFENYLKKKIVNVQELPCYSVNFYGDFDEFKSSTVEEILRNSSSFIETRVPKKMDETVYIYEV